MVTSEDFYYAFSGENREICGLVIHQPRVGEILKYELDVDEMVQPFLAFIDLWEIDEEQKKNYKNLDLIFYDHVFCEKEGVPQNSMLTAMINTLIYLCRTNDIEYDLNRGVIKVNGVDKIDRTNFDELQSFILSIFYTRKPKPLKVKGSDRQKQKVLEMQKKLAKHRKNKALNIADIVKVVHNGRGFIPHGELLQFTYWQLMDGYSDIIKIDAYKTHMDYKLSPKYELKDTDFKHWTEELKVQKN